MSRPTKRSWRAARGDEVVPGRRVVERLGGGARTEVYRCTDEATGTPVVVKLLRPGRTSPSDTRMLRRESRTLRTLDHPGLPRLLDADLSSDPPWLVMSHVEGPHLSDLLDAHGPLDDMQAAAVATDIGDALAHLHDRDLVHLDVKPSNIVMSVRPVLLDLGAARRIDRAARLRPGVGTLAWLSPEQADPATFGPPGPASDVWGLGVVLLWTLTARNPLVARRELDTTDEAALARACRREARRVGSTMRELVLACLATDAADRPSARQVAAGLPGPGRA